MSELEKSLPAGEAALKKSQSSYGAKGVDKCYQNYMPYYLQPRIARST